MDFGHADLDFTIPIIRAVVTNNVDEVKEALGQGYDINLQDRRGWTPLHIAASMDASSDCLKELLTNTSVDVNKKTFKGYTPIFLACQNGCLKTATLLLKHPKCNLHLFNNKGVHPIHVACRQEKLEIVKILVEFGADVNAHDFKGNTPLHEAVSNETGTQEQDEIRSQICQFLLNHNANPDVCEDISKNFPLHIACESGLLKSLNLLFEFSKRDLINVCNKAGYTPLMLAVKSCNLSVVEALLSRGANPNVVDQYKDTLLHHAAKKANFEIFSLLHKATCNEFILQYCTLDKKSDMYRLWRYKSVNSLICMAIDTEDLSFLIKMLELNLDPSVLNCPMICCMNEDCYGPIFLLNTPISFLLQYKMDKLGERIIDFLSALISHGSPLKVTSKEHFKIHINPICACLYTLNDDCPVNIVMRCLRMLLDHGADPDEPHIRSIPFAMEQACTRGCAEAALLLLQFSNVLEPEDVIKWIEQKTSIRQENPEVYLISEPPYSIGPDTLLVGQENILKVLLPLAPHYTPSDTLLADFMDNSQRKSLLAPKVYSLASYCRTVVRKQLRQESKSSPLFSFRQRLLGLPLPKDICLFLSFM